MPTGGTCNGRPRRPRRTKLEVWCDILTAVSRAQDRPGVAPVPSRIQSAANVPYARFRRHLDQLVDNGLLRADPLEVTARGARFLRESREVRALLDRFGLREHDPMPGAAADPFGLDEGAAGEEAQAFGADVRDPSAG